MAYIGNAPYQGSVAGTNILDGTIETVDLKDGNVTGAKLETLAGLTSGTYGNSTAIPAITIDVKGRVTAISTTAVSIPSGSISVTGGDLTLSGSTGTAITDATLASVGTAGTYTKVTTDAKGRVTSGTTLASSDLPTYTGTITSSQVTTALGFIPENIANKATANGYASLDGSGKVPSAQLPSYVDDVLEYANLAAFPATGSSGIIYVTQDTNKTYRWTGSAYVEISPSPGTTDSLTEGSTNLYYTNTRARASLSFTAGSGAYNSTTGAITIPTNTTHLTNGSGYITGNQTVTLSGDASGSGATAITVTLASSGVTAGTYNNVTVDAKGRVTSGSNASYLTTSGKAADSELLDGQDSTGFLRLLSGGAEASIDSYTDNGFRAVSYTGHSKHMLSWNAGGSTGTVQQEFHYNTPANGWRIRNKTDNSSWSSWGNVVMASSNQGLISGTIYHSGNPPPYPAEADTLATVTARGASASVPITITGNGSYIGNWGYSTLILQDTGGYPGINYRSGNSNWLVRMNAGGSQMDWAYSSNASAQGVGGYTQYLTLSTSLLLHPSSMRAPIFYDSDNTGYYVDPNNTGTSGVFAGQLVVGDGIRAATSSYITPYNLFALSDTYDGGSYYGIKYVEGSPDTIQIIGANNVGLSIGMDVGDTTASSSLRAPIFYDSNDTGYYCNPNSVSRLYRTESYYFRNIYTPSTDHPFGLYFDSGESTAYAIYRESGAWTHPYPDLRIAFHTGIKLGANSGYNGIRFYTDYDMSSQVMSVNNGSDGLGANNVYVNNSLQAGSSLRAPIFYDSDNTGYYIDPASTSNFSALNVGGSAVLTTGNYTSYISSGSEPTFSAFDGLPIGTS